MTSRRRDAGVDRLTELPYDHEIIPNPLTQRTKNLLPGRGQRLVRIPEHLWHAGPRCCIAITWHQYLSWLPATSLARNARSMANLSRLHHVMKLGQIAYQLPSNVH